MPFRKLTGYVVLCTSFPPVPVKLGLILKTPLNALYHSQSSQGSNVAAPRTSQCGRKRLMTKLCSWQISVFILRPLCRTFIIISRKFLSQLVVAFNCLWKQNLRRYSVGRITLFRAGTTDFRIRATENMKKAKRRNLHYIKQFLLSIYYL